VFDIAFSELLVIGVVALIVIGPEKLPKIARTVGHLLGKAQRYVQQVKLELNNELQTEGLSALEKEIRLNLQHVKAASLEVGQVIQHEMPETTPKYQVGQVIRHVPEGAEAEVHLPSANALHNASVTTETAAPQDQAK
jgi:sec-independent protein translocase protein TatB